MLLLLDWERALLCSIEYGEVFRLNEKEDSMGLPNRDEIEGKLDQAKGAVKEPWAGTWTSRLEVKAAGSHRR